MDASSATLPPHEPRASGFRQAGPQQRHFLLVAQQRVGATGQIFASPLTLLLIVLTAPHSLSAQQAHVNLDWNPQANTAQLTPYGAAIISPELHLLNDPAINERVDYLFVGQGTLEAKPGNRTDALRAALEKHGIEHEYYMGGGGGHDWATWRHLLHARFLPGLWRPAPPL